MSLLMHFHFFYNILLFQLFTFMANYCSRFYFYFVDICYQLFCRLCDSFLFSFAIYFVNLLPYVKIIL